MVKVTDKIEFVNDFDLDIIYNNYSIIIEHNDCNYVFILNDDFGVEQVFLCFERIQLAVTKLTKLIFTNSKKLLNLYIKSKKPKTFETLEQYSVWLKQASEFLKVIDITRFQMFSFKDMQSNSELINVSAIKNWWAPIQKSVKYMPKEQLQIYNLYNFTLYLLERDFPQISDNSIKTNFNNLSPNQSLTIDLNHNRCVNRGCGINYYSIRDDEKKWRTVKPKPDHLFYKIDFKQSYLQLLCYILDIEIDGDMYGFLGKKLELPDNQSRSNIKGKVFQILFSNQIKNYTDIQLFNKAYLFSLYLQQQYNEFGYVKTLLSQKKLKFGSDQVFSRSKLLNMYIMSLQTQLYVGLLYQLFHFNKSKIIPCIFVYDGIIMSVDVNYVLQNIVQIESLLTLNGKLHLSRYLGSNLLNLHAI